MYLRRISITAFVMLMAACVGEGSDEGGHDWTFEENAGDREGPHTVTASDRPDSEASNASTAEVDEVDGFVAHEWGTFTAVQDSEGEYLEGLHHEEEPLPAFVHQLDHMGVHATKGMPFLPEPVTQKLETPVIYFYADEPLEARVSVDFPEGVVSEWYPDASNQGSSLYDMEEMELADGYMDWSIELSHAAAELVEVPEDDIWAPSREVPEAMYVSHRDETEKFIFYRGLGRFEPPFRVTTTDDEMITVANHSANDIEHVYLIEVDQEAGYVKELGSLDGFDERTYGPAPKEDPVDLDEMVEEASDLVAKGLVETGLTRDEAIAMVDTWSRSYFRTPGRRILYTVPREWTDDLLPLRIDPEPDELVRTLVGRVEALSPEQERRTRDAIVSAYEDDASLTPEGEPRFSEPRMRRGCQLVEDDDIASWCENQLGLIELDVYQMPF